MTDSYLPRAEYEFSEHPIGSEQVDPDPIVQFRIWFEKEARSGERDGNRMALATADDAGRPSVRMVLLKQFGTDGFLFFTDYGSRKAIELEQNRHAALLFHWPRLQRQVRIEGAVDRVSREISEHYFSLRPRTSQAGASVSRQSEPLLDRDRFESEVRNLEGGSDPIPCPESWGGYRLVAERFEFWQGQPGRVHNRIVYLPGGDGWQRSELQP